MYQSFRFLGQKMHFKTLCILFTLFTLTACSDDDAKSLSLSERSIVYCAEGSPETFNPQLVTSGTTIDATAHQLYDRLITFKNDDNTIAPGLAKSWHVTQDGKMVTFYLRKDVHFHQTKYFTPTRTLNADDVLFSFNRIIDENHPYHDISGGNYPFFQSIQFSELIEKIEKINDYTVRFKLTHPDSSFLANLATDFAIILSSEYGEQLSKTHRRHEIDIFPIGTGPFKLKEYRVGSMIRYYRHEQYWQEKAKVEQLVFDITPSNTSRLTKLLAKECDVVAYPIAHQKIIDRPDLLLESITSFNVGYLGFNTQKPPFDQKMVRQAISYAINKQALIDTVYHGRAEIAQSILPPESWAYDNHIIGQKFNITKAKRLLSKAGYEQGFSMDLWAMPVQRAYNPNAITMAKLIQADLSKIGVKVTIVSFEWSAFLRRLNKGEHQSFLLGWSADHPDPDNFFTPMLSCASTLTGSNRTFWCNPQYDKIIQQALQTNSTKERKKLYSQALMLIGDELPLLPIAHSKRFQARGKNVVGKIMRPFGGINFSHVDKLPLTSKSSKTNENETLKNTKMMSAN